jgi:hypothetical protein
MRPLTVQARVRPRILLSSEDHVDPVLGLDRHSPETAYSDGGSAA